MKAGTWIPAALALALVGTSASAQNRAPSPGAAGAGRTGVRPGGVGTGGRTPGGVGTRAVAPGTVGTGNPRPVTGQTRFQPSTGGFYGGGGFYNGGPQNTGGMVAGDQANTGAQQGGATARGANASRPARRGSDRVRFGPRAQAELKNPPGAFRPGQAAVNAQARGERVVAPDPVVANRANDPIKWRDPAARSGNTGRFGPRARAELKNRPGAFRPAQSAVNAQARGDREVAPDPVVTNRANDPIAWTNRRAGGGNAGRFGPRAQQELANPAGALRPGRNAGAAGGSGEDTEDPSLLSTMESRMRSRPFIEGTVVAADENRVQVRYKADAETGTLNFKPDWVYFYTNRGRLTSAATEPGLVTRGMKVLIPEMTAAQIRASAANNRPAATRSRTSTPRSRPAARVLSNRVVR